jgi:hypothetical protein
MYYKPDGSGRDLYIKDSVNAKQPKYYEFTNDLRNYDKRMLKSNKILSKTPILNPKSYDKSPSKSFISATGMS